jgi:hypothetical protein
MNFKIIHSGVDGLDDGCWEVTISRVVVDTGCNMVELLEGVAFEF